MEPPAFPAAAPRTLRAAPGSSATLHLPLPTGTPPFHFQWSRAGASLDERFTASDDAGGVRLTVSAARTGDSGVYTLQASNEAGSDLARVRLEVSADEAPSGDDPPAFLRRLQDLTVKVGTRTRFLVEIVSSTECKVTWYRNERRLMEAERISLARDGHFWCADVSAVSVDDAGRWTCTAENAGGRASCSAHLNVLVPKAYKRPEFVEELRALLTEQGTVSLECKVVGVPTPVLRWFKDSREIKAGDVFALTANAEDPTSLGTYTCEAVNCMGRAYSSSKVHVVGRGSREGSAKPTSVTPEPPPIFTKELEPRAVRICEPLALGCQLVVPPWPRAVVWYNKEGKVEPSHRYHILEDGVGGYLMEVSSAEWCDEGEWKCVATSPGGRVGISTTYVTMDVPKNYRKPRFMENLQAVLTEEGLVSFECKVVGFPTPVLSWFKDGQELKPGDVYQLTGTNSLGSYCCIARNCMGRASSSAELTVEDIQNQLNEEEKLQLFSKNQAPKFVSGLKSVEARIDEPFRFTIKVQIPPEPSVMWYRDDQPIDESTRCHLGKEDKGLFFLDIQNLELLDQAEWKCVAMNDYGHSVTSCFLKLLIPRHYKKPRFLENLQAILSDEGAVNLECKVIGVPQPILKWYKDGEELKPGDIHRIISGQDGTCCLGTYTCEAQNCMGIAASSASLLGFDESIKAKKKKTEEQILQRNLSLSTIHEERTSQMYDTPVGDITLDDKGEISFSFDGKEVSVSLYETPDLTEEEALQIVEMYADQLSENVTEHNVVELPPLRFVKETSTSGNLLMEAIIIDVSPDYFVSPEEDLRTEADVEDISIADENAVPQLSLDTDLGGEDYLEKTMALLSEEKSDVSKKMLRKKSDSVKSGEDFFSLSREQSLSEDKRDDDTQVSESFASARSSAKMKSKSTKPSEKEGKASSDVTKTIVFKEEAQKHAAEPEPSPVVKPKRERRSSRGSRRSSSGSDKSLSRSRDEPRKKPEPEKEKVEPKLLPKPELTNEEFKNKMINASVSLSKVINDVQVIERDIILKSELMSSAATASRSLEIINSLITPLSEIHSIADAVKESAPESKEVSGSLFSNLPQPLKALQQTLTIIQKCIDVESDSKTLVKRTCVAFIQTCGNEMQKLMIELNSVTSKLYLSTDEKTLSDIDVLTKEVSSVLKDSVETVKTKNLVVETSESKTEEASHETKHLRDTQKAVFELRNPLNSLLCIAGSAESSQIHVAKVKHSDVILTEMSASIQDLQAALEQIESLSVKESTTSLHKYNTDIIETVMDSVLKLRSSFEQLSTEARSEEDKTVLKQALASIKHNLSEISSHIDTIEQNVGTFDVLQSDNKLEVLQKMAQILIALENNLPRLEVIPEVKTHLDGFHKNLTKVLENVIESNDAKKYFTLIEICDAVNRVNSSIKNIETDNMLALASLSNTIKIIQEYFVNNVFESELNCSILSNIADVLVGIEEAVNHADEISMQIDSEHIQDILTQAYEGVQAQTILQQIDQTIAAVSKVKSLETTKELKLALTPVLETISPVLEELKRSVASARPSGVEQDEHVSEISEMSLAQTLATPICELNQNIVVLNQMIVENIDSIKDTSEIIATIAEPLHELHTTLEVLQQVVISQYGDDIATCDVSVNMASMVQNLQSCIVMIQEQAGVEPIDEMSTLEDISGIKTTADAIPLDHLILPTAEETKVEQGLFTFNQELSASVTAHVLQSLNEHITVLQCPEILDALDSLSEVSDFSSLKSVALGLGDLHAGIEEILHPIVMESSRELGNLINASKLTAIAEPMQELQQSLSILDTSNIPIYEHILEIPAERIHSVLKTVTEFREQLDKCIKAVFPAMETADKTIEISNKVETLREVCEHLKDIFTTVVSQDVSVKQDIIALQQTVENLLNATDVSKGIKIDNVKTITEELYQNIVTVQEEIIQFIPHTHERLSQEALMIQAIDEIENNIAVLEQYEFVDLSRASDITSCTSPQLAMELESESLLQMDDIVENAVNVVQDSTQDTPIADLMIIEDFFKTCKNEFTILRCLMNKQLSHKKIIRILQEFASLQSSINEFRHKRGKLKLSSDIDSYLTTFLIHADDCLQNVQESLVKIVQSQSEVLIKQPLKKLEETKKALKQIPEGKISPQIAEVAKKFGEVIDATKPCTKNAEKAIIEELKDNSSLSSKVHEKHLTEKMEEVTAFLEQQSNLQSLDDDSKQILQKVLTCIQKHDDYRDAMGTGKVLIILKCLSECSDVLQESLLDIKPKTVVEPKIEDNALKAVLTEMLVPLQALHSQLVNVQEQILSGANEDTISVDIPSTESFVQTMSEIHKEIQQVESGKLAVDSEEISLIMDVDKKIHTIQDSIRSMENVPAAQVVKEISKPIDDIEKSLHNLLSSEKVLESKGKLPADVNSNIDSLESALERFINIEIDLMATLVLADIDVKESIQIAINLKQLLALLTEAKSLSLETAKLEKVTLLEKILTKFDWLNTDKYLEGKNTLETEKLNRVFLTTYQLLAELNQVSQTKLKYEAKKEKAAQLIQHIDQYIELIEIVEEISAVIKIENLKETANIAREFRDTITASESSADVQSRKSNDIEISSEQVNMAYKLQKAVSAFQVQVLDSAQELAPALGVNVLQRIAQITAQLQADLVAVTGIQVAVQAPADFLSEVTKSLKESLSLDTVQQDLDESQVAFTETHEAVVMKKKKIDKGFDYRTEDAATKELTEKTVAESQQEIIHEVNDLLSQENINNAAQVTSNVQLVSVGKAGEVVVVETDVLPDIPTISPEEKSQPEKADVKVEELQIISEQVKIIEKHEATAHERAMETLKQHIEVYTSKDVVEVIEKISELTNFDELKQSIKVAQELSESITVTETGTEGETSVLSCEIQEQQAQIVQQLQTALNEFRTIILTGAAELTVIEHDSLQKVIKVAKQIQDDLQAVVKIEELTSLAEPMEEVAYVDESAQAKKTDVVDESTAVIISEVLESETAKPLKKPEIIEKAIESTISVEMAHVISQDIEVIGETFAESIQEKMKITETRPIVLEETEIKEKLENAKSQDIIDFATAVEVTQTLTSEEVEVLESKELDKENISESTSKALIVATTSEMQVISPTPGDLTVEKLVTDVETAAASEADRLIEIDAVAVQAPVIDTLTKDTNTETIFEDQMIKQNEVNLVSVTEEISVDFSLELSKETSEVNFEANEAAVLVDIGNRDKNYVEQLKEIVQEHSKETINDELFVFEQEVNQSSIEGSKKIVDDHKQNRIEVDSEIILTNDNEMATEILEANKFNQQTSLKETESSRRIYAENVLEINEVTAESQEVILLEVEKTATALPKHTEIALEIKEETLQEAIKTRAETQVLDDSFEAADVMQITLFHKNIEPQKGIILQDDVNEVKLTEQLKVEGKNIKQIAMDESIGTSESKQSSPTEKVEPVAVQAVAIKDLDIISVEGDVIDDCLEIFDLKPLQKQAEIKVQNAIILKDEVNKVKLAEQPAIERDDSQQITLDELMGATENIQSCTVDHFEPDVSVAIEKTAEVSSEGKVFDDSLEILDFVQPQQIQEEIEPQRAVIQEDDVNAVMIMEQSTIKIEKIHHKHSVEIATSESLQSPKAEEIHTFVRQIVAINETADASSVGKASDNSLEKSTGKESQQIEEDEKAPKAVVQEVHVTADRIKEQSTIKTEETQQKTAVEIAASESLQSSITDEIQALVGQIVVIKETADVSSKGKVSDNSLEKTAVNESQQIEDHKKSHKGVVQQVDVTADKITEQSTIETEETPQLINACKSLQSSTAEEIKPFVKQIGAVEETSLDEKVLEDCLAIKQLPQIDEEKESQRDVILQDNMTEVGIMTQTIIESQEESQQKVAVELITTSEYLVEEIQPFMEQNINTEDTVAVISEGTELVATLDAVKITDEKSFVGENKDEDCVQDTYTTHATDMADNALVKESLEGQLSDNTHNLNDDNDGHLLVGEQMLSEIGLEQSIIEISEIELKVKESIADERTLDNETVVTEIVMLKDDTVSEHATENNVKDNKVMSQTVEVILLGTELQNEIENPKKQEVNLDICNDNQLTVMDNLKIAKENSALSTEHAGLIQHIEDFISCQITEKVGDLSTIEQLKESVGIAQELRETIAAVDILAASEDTVLVAEEAKIEEAKLAQKLQDSLCTLQMQVLGSAQEIAAPKDAESIKRVSEVVTHLQEDLKSAFVNAVKDEIKTEPEIPQDVAKQSSMKDLEDLLQIVNKKINVTSMDQTPEDTEELKDTLGEVQTVIIKLKRDCDGAGNDTLNETLEDLECSVRSVQLQINENSPPELVKEACATLQPLANNMTNINDVHLHETIVKQVKTDDVLEKCSTEANETVKLLDAASKLETKGTGQLKNIVACLSNLKDILKTLRESFLNDADTLIEKGVEVLQNLNLVEDKVFSLEKDVDYESNLELSLKENIISAVHSVYGSISNMRSTISSIQKQYMYENYGKPSESLLRSIKNISTFLAEENKVVDKSDWKKVSKSLRNTLNHFEDVKFYINLDKTARLPSDAAFTKIILEELKSNIAEIILPFTNNFDPGLSIKSKEVLQSVHRTLNILEPRATLEVKEKIPIFKDIATQFLNLTEGIKSKFEESKDDSIQNQEKQQEEIETPKKIPERVKEKPKDELAEPKPSTSKDVMETRPEYKTVDEEKLQTIEKQDDEVKGKGIKKRDSKKKREEERRKQEEQAKINEEAERVKRFKDEENRIQEIQKFESQKDDKEDRLEKEKDVNVHLELEKEVAKELGLEEKQVEENRLKDKKEENEAKINRVKEEKVEKLHPQKEKETEELCQKEKVTEEVRLQKKKNEEVKLNEEQELQLNKEKVTEEANYKTEKDVEQAIIKEEKKTKEVKKANEELDVRLKEEKVAEKAHLKQTKESEKAPSNKQKEEQKEHLKSEETGEEARLKEEKETAESRLEKEIEVDEDRIKNEQLLMQKEKEFEEELLKKERLEEKAHLKKVKEARLKKEKEDEEAGLRKEKEDEEALLKKQQDEQLRLNKEKEAEEARIKKEKEKEDTRLYKEQEEQVKKKETEDVCLQKEEEARLKKEKEAEEARINEEQEKQLRIQTEKETDEERLKREKLEEEVRLENQKVSEVSHLKKEKEQEEQLRLKKEKEAEEARLKKEEEARLKKEKKDEQARLKKEQDEQMCIKKEKEAEEACLKKDKDEEDARFNKEQELQLRLKKEKDAEEARLKKEKEEEEARFKKEQIELLRLKKEKEAEEVRLNKEKEEEEARLKKEQEEQLRLKKEKDVEEARLKKEQEEKETRLKKEKQDEEARLKKEQDEKLRIKKEKETEEACLKKEKEEKDARLNKEQEEQLRPKNEKDAEEARLKKEKEEEEARLKKEQEEQMRLEKEKEAEEARLKKEKEEEEARLKKEQEEQLRLKKEKDVEEARLKKEQEEKETRLKKKKQDEEARLKKEQYEKLRIKKEKEAEEACLKKEKEEEDVRLNKEQEEQLRLKEEKKGEEARLKKEKAEEEARLKKEQEEQLRLKKEKEAEEARLKKEKEEEKARLKKEQEEQLRLKKEKDVQEARLKKEQEEKETRLKKEKQDEEARLKKEQDEKLSIKKEKEAEEACLKKEKEEKDSRLNKELEEQLRLKNEKDAEEARLKKEKEEEEARLKKEQEEQLRLEKEKEAEEARLKKKKEEEEARLKKEQEEQLRLKKEKDVEEARLKKEQEEKETRLKKDKQDEEARLKKEQDEKLRIKKEKEAEEACLKKEKEEEDARLNKEQEEQLRLKEETKAEEARLKKEKAEEEARLMKEQEEQLRLKKEKEAEEARLKKEKEEEEARRKTEQEEQLRLQKEKEAEEARVKKEKEEEEARLQKEKEAEESRVKKEKEEQLHLKKEKEAEEARLKKEKEEEEARLKKEQEEQLLLKREKEAKEARLKKKKEEEEARLQKDKEAEESRVKKEKEEQLHLEKEKEAEEARLRKGKEEEEAHLKKEQDEELRLNKEKEAKQARLKKEKEDEKARLKIEQEEQLRLKKEKEEEESRLRKEQDEQLHLKKEKEAEEARLKKEKKETEARLKNEKEEEEARVKNEQEEQLHLKKGKKAEEAHVKKEKEAEETRLKQEKQNELALVKKEKEAEEARVNKEKEAEEARVKKEKETEEARLKKEKEAEEAQLKKEKEAKEARVKKDKEAEEARLIKEKEVEDLRFKKEEIACVKEAKNVNEANPKKEKEDEEVLLKKEKEEELRLKKEKQIEETRLKKEKECKDEHFLKEKKEIYSHSKKEKEAQKAFMRKEQVVQMLENDIPKQNGERSKLRRRSKESVTIDTSRRSQDEVKTALQGSFDQTQTISDTQVYTAEYDSPTSCRKFDDKEKPRFVDHNHRDFTMEFARPSGYRERSFDDKSILERDSYGRSPLIYKAQTIVLDSQLRSSFPPVPEVSHRSESERRSEVRQRSIAISEARSIVSEKRSSVPRDVKRKPVFSTYLTDRTAVEGSRVKLTCSVLCSGDPTITWYKNGVVLDKKLKYRTKLVDGLITLEVLNAVPSDSAEYSCTVENENGSVSSSANLKVYPSFEASPIPPTFTRSIRDTYHLAENELVLECRIRGQPLPSITWLKDDKVISTNERYQAYYLADGVCRLAINHPTPDDSGKYTCKAENSVWSDQINHVVNFTGHESRLSPNIATIERSRFNRAAIESRRPHFGNVLTDYKVPKGGTIGLQVEIRGCPTRVEWLREGRSVTDVYGNARTFVEQGLYTLALADVTEKESGMYTCRAWSTHGTVDMNAAITVVQPNELEGRPAIIVGRPEKDVLISVGEDLNISFRVQGEPKPKVIFMKGIRDITNSQRVCKMTSDDYVKFTVKRSVISDAGTYCILARNAYGCDRAFVTVVIRQRESSDNLISDWTYPSDNVALDMADRQFKAVPERIPGEPSVVDCGANWVSIAWPKPEARGAAPVLAYRVDSWLLGKEGGARWLELGITPLNSFDAFNLKQGEKYHFRVTPRNRYGWGEAVQTSTPVAVGLAGDRPEFVDILPGQLKVLVGQTAHLSCSVKGKPTPAVVWMKNGHEVDEDARIKTSFNGYNCSITIVGITAEDEARYSCEATNAHGRASTYARLAVVTDRMVWEADAKLKRERSEEAEGDFPPQFTMRLRDRRVQATYPVRLTCQVVGSPAPTLTWFKDGQLVHLDSRRIASQDEHFHTLEIAPTTLEDGGMYEALARNTSGAVSCRCCLVVDKGIRAYVAPEFCCGLEPLYRLFENEELRISAVVEAYPSVGVTWYRDGVRLRTSRRAVMTLDRDGQIELALASVTPRDAGVYTCTASNEVGTASTSGKVEVIGDEHAVKKRSPPMVVSPDVPYSKEPMFTRKPRSSEAREGDTVIIVCEVIGDPKPDVYWLRDFLKPDYYRDATHFKRVGAGPEYRFEIPHAKLDYTGAYSVVAKNVHGEAKAIISLQILAKDPTSSEEHNVRYGRVEVIPRFEKNLTDLLSYDGDAVEFECRVSGHPEPDIRWFHYTEIIRDCTDFETSYEDGTARLKIKQVTADDEGTYACEASNTLGKASSTACLVVYPPGEPNTLSQRLRRPPALLSAASTPRSTPRSTPARSVSRTPGPDCRRVCSPSRQMAPKFYTYPYNKVAEEGDTVVLQCAARGLPVPWTTWDKDGVVIKPSSRITIKEKDDMMRILEIEQVSVEDVGLYRVTLENDYGRVEACARLEVITREGRFHAGVRSYSASPRRARRHSASRQD